MSICFLKELMVIMLKLINYVYMLYKLINYKVINEYTSFFLFGIITKGFYSAT